VLAYSVIWLCLAPDDRFLKEFESTKKIQPINKKQINLCFRNKNPLKLSWVLIGELI